MVRSLALWLELKLTRRQPLFPNFHATRILSGREVKQKSWSPAQAEEIRQQLKMQDEQIIKQWEENEADKRNADGRIARPWLWENTDLTVENQPVVGISWFETCAYAEWLSEVIHAQGLLAETACIRLPTEAEWEKAARGGGQGLWSWGNRWNTNRANTLEGRVMKPSSVGAYPGGESKHGTQEMIGNVWEWCRDWYAEDTYKNRSRQEVRDPLGPEAGRLRVLRGGLWFNDRFSARCAYRDWDEPDDFNSSVGFRLVLSTPLYVAQNKFCVTAGNAARPSGFPRRGFKDGRMLS